MVARAGRKRNARVFKTFRYRLMKGLPHSVVVQSTLLAGDEITGGNHEVWLDVHDRIHRPVNRILVFL